MRRRNVWRAALARLGLALTTLGRRRRPRRKLTLLADPERTTVLVWAMGCGADDATLGQTLDRVLPTARVVVALDSLTFEPLVQRGALIEALPDAAVRGRLPGRDWGLYVDRRIARIRDSWDADLEIVVGAAPAAFVALCARPADPSEAEASPDHLEAEADQVHG